MDRQAVELLEEQLIYGAGYVILKSPEEGFMDICTRFGTLRPQNEERDHIVDIKDVGGRRGYQSNKRLPFHTDCGSDLLALKRITDGDTRVVDAHLIYQNMGAHSAVLHEDFPFQWGKFPIFVRKNDVLYCRYLRGYIAEERLFGGQIYALDLFDELAELHASNLTLKPGDVCILNNTRMLHSREAFTDPNRCAQRIWIDSPKIKSPYKNRF